MKNYSSITVGSRILAGNSIYEVYSIRTDGKFYAENVQDIDDVITGYINHPYRKV